MVVEYNDYNMTDNNSQSTHTSPELHRSKLRSSFKMIRKLFKAKKQASSSTGDLSTRDSGDDQSINNDHASFTGSPPPPYRSNSFNKSVGSLGSASSGGGELPERREALKQDHTDASSALSRTVTVTIRRDSDALLGIVIGVGSERAASYPIVRRVLPDSQASKSGAVFCGDEILKVNNTDVFGMTHKQVTSLFKSNGRQLVLQVRRKVPDLFLSMGAQTVNTEGSPPCEDGNVLGSSKNKSQVIEICRNDTNSDIKESTVQLSTFHPKSPQSLFAPQVAALETPSKVPPPVLPRGDDKNKSEEYERFSRRAYSASAAVRSMKSPRHTLLVPGSADVSLLTMQDILSPQSAPASPAESRKCATDDEQDKEDEKRYDFRDSTDVTEAWSAAPFVRSHSMRSPRKPNADGWRDRSASVNEKKKGSRRRFRDSFRIGKKSKPTDTGVKDSHGNAAKNGDQKGDSTSSNKVLTVDLPVPSLQELGLRLTGGSVSPYGTCNLTAQSVSIYGTAKEMIKPGDSILTIDGINTEQMTAFEAYRLLQNYIGRTVKVELARSFKK